MAFVNVNVAFCDGCQELISPGSKVIQLRNKLRNKLFHNMCFRDMSSLEIINMLEVPHDLGYIKSVGSIGETGVHNSLFVSDKEEQEDDDF